MTSPEISTATCSYAPEEFARITANIRPRHERSGYPETICAAAVIEAATAGSEDARLVLCGLVRRISNGTMEVGCRECGAVREAASAILSAPQA